MATQAMLQDRQAVHGSFSKGAEIEQELKSVMREAPNWDKLPPPHKAALEMTCHKIARHLVGDYLCVDHITDAIGYLQRLLECTKTLPGAYEIVTSKRMLTSK